MSTIGITAGFDSRLDRVRSIDGPLKLTRRGQVVVVAVFLMAALALMVVFGGLATATKDAGEPLPVKVVEVQPGDTLYGIAGDVAGPGEVRDVVHKIEQLNSLQGGALQVGDKIAVPLN
ncbi:MAG TPA: LysM peptidoglycan-binding domain-containing protein [Mycobacteriales bacterium]|nr:LysM peptidoglycan-binding domain-containing protein [Mycobacteriales bacterium]